jgi:hypothetical protein
LDGQIGRDILTGGAGADVFVFEAAYGHDTITDFNPDVDRIDLHFSLGIDNFRDLMRHHVETKGNDLIIFGDGSGDQLRLLNVRPEELHKGDFHFF